MEGSKDLDKKAQPLQLVCSNYSSELQQLLMLHKVIWVFLLCEGVLALGKTCWTHVDLQTLKVKESELSPMLPSWDPK